MMDNFAKKLAAGLVSVPSRMSWWPRHSRSMIRYACLGHEKQPASENVRQMISMTCMEWEGLIPTAARKGLMGHHALLEMQLADAAMMKDCAKIEKTGSLLLENAEEMAASFGKSVVEFPEMQFLKLLAEHVVSYAELVRKKVEAVNPNGSRMENNTIALAAFTNEWF